MVDRAYKTGDASVDMKNGAKDMAHDVKDNVKDAFHEAKAGVNERKARTRHRPEDRRSCCGNARSAARAAQG